MTKPAFVQQLGSFGINEQILLEKRLQVIVGKHADDVFIQRENTVSTRFIIGDRNAKRPEYKAVPIRRIQSLRHLQRMKHVAIIRQDGFHTKPFNSAQRLVKLFVEAAILPEDTFITALRMDVPRHFKFEHPQFCAVKTVQNGVDEMRVEQRRILAVVILWERICLINKLMDIFEHMTNTVRRCCQWQQIVRIVTTVDGVVDAGGWFAIFTCQHVSYVVHETMPKAGRTHRTGDGIVVFIDDRSDFACEIHSQLATLFGKQHDFWIIRRPFFHHGDYFVKATFHARRLIEYRDVVGAEAFAKSQTEIVVKQKECGTDFHDAFYAI